jgi:hypothetical protein
MTTASAKRDGVPPAIRPSRSVLQHVHGLTREKGRIAAIEPRSGQYFLGDTLMGALRAARRRHPGAVFYIVRVGHAAAYVHHGGLRKGKP